MKKCFLVFSVTLLLMVNSLLAGNKNILMGFKITVDNDKNIQVAALDTQNKETAPVMQQQDSGQSDILVTGQMAATTTDVMQLQSQSQPRKKQTGSRLFYTNNSLSTLDATDNALAQADLFIYTGSEANNYFNYNTGTTEFQVINSVANGGNAAAGIFRLGWYLSDDITVDENDYLITSSPTTGQLQSGYYVELEGTAVLSSLANLPDSEYYVMIVVDDLNQVNEADETNNFNYFSDVTIDYGGSGLADLLVYTGTGSTNTFTYDPANGLLTVTNSIGNNGNTVANNFYVGWYLTKLPILTTNAFKISMVSETSGLEPQYYNNYSLNSNLHDFGNLPSGNYYLWVFADCSNMVKESNEANNSAYFSDTKISYSGAGQPDLAVFQGTAATNGYRYDDMTKQLDIVNSIGNFGQTAAQSFRTGWYLSTDLNLTTADVIVAAEQTTEALLPNYYININTGADLSALSVTAGLYYVIIFIDDNGQVAESDEDNNASYFYEQLQYGQTSGDPDINIQNASLYLNPDAGNIRKAADKSETPSAQQKLDSQIKADHAAGELLIKFRDTVTPQQITAFMQQHGLETIKAYKILPNTFHVRITDQQPAGDKARSLMSLPQVEIVDLNMKSRVHAVPNDPGFDGLFGMHNEGQTGGEDDADIDAPEAWDIETGSGQVIVGILDSGIDYDHPDLEDNMWINADEIPDNGVDDDDNGYIDDIHGWDFAYGDNDPSDYCGHGTHVAGTVGAIGNNGIGVAGVCWNVKLMALKYLNDESSGWTNDMLTAFEYGVANGVDIIQNSTGGGSYEEVLKRAIANTNTLFVSSAGNDAKDTDEDAAYPSAYNCANILAVAALDHNNDISTFSNFGAQTVDLAAYGTDILSTKPYNETEIDFGAPGSGLDPDYYGIISGTSMSTPQVSGAAALLLSHNPDYTWQELKSAIMENVDVVSSMLGKCVTHGKLNVYKALNASGTVTNKTIFVIQNQGLQTLTVSAITSNKTWLTVTGYPAAPFTINSGYFQQVQVNVNWNQAGTAAQQGTITIQSNDPDEPQVTVTVHINSGTVIAELDAAPTGFTLGRNYPNPFNPATKIDYSLPVRSHVKLSVYNVLGQQVALLVNEIRDAGNYNVTFDAAGLESGVYLYKFEAGDYSRTEKMLLVK
ncbi:MAG TPA: S8 family serine peptidase [bacterium]|nr:S8 family serine peptidase [bacterium]HPN46222.1 S8 family serine peptidase [bacterium]